MSKNKTIDENRYPQMSTNGVYRLNITHFYSLNTSEKKNFEEYLRSSGDICVPLWFKLRFSVRMHLCYMALFMWALGLHAGEEGIRSEVQKALAYSQAGEYAEAQNIYLKLLQEPLQEWQRSIILFDLASALMGEKKWENAIQILHQIPLNNDLQPILKYRQAYNLSFAYLNNGLAAYQAHRIKHAQNSFQRTLEQIAIAEQSHCELEQIRGIEKCDTVESLETMRQIAKKYLKEAANTKEEGLQEEAQSSKNRETKEKEKKQEEVLQALIRMSQQDSKPVIVPKSNKKELRPW